jgi:hypothetical protein
MGSLNPGDRAGRRSSKCMMAAKRPGKAGYSWRATERTSTFTSRSIAKCPKARQAPIVFLRTCQASAATPCSQGARRPAQEPNERRLIVRLHRKASHRPIDQLNGECSSGVWRWVYRVQVIWSPGKAITNIPVYVRARRPASPVAIAVTQPASGNPSFPVGEADGVDVLT